jgi:hypothetical protein
MSTNQPNPLAPALAPFSGAKTSIFTGLARCDVPVAHTIDGGPNEQDAQPLLAATLVTQGGCAIRTPSRVFCGRCMA